MPNKYTLDYLERGEVLAGKPSKAKYIFILRNGKKIASIKYEIIGKTLKVWNRTVGKDINDRRKQNAKFEKHPENKDARTLGTELLFQARLHEAHTIGPTTPHRTASSKTSITRTKTKYGINWNSPWPKGMKGIVSRRGKR